jgi:hypothetical protein
MWRHLLGIILFLLALIISYNLILRFDVCKLALCCNA